MIIVIPYTLDRRDGLELRYTIRSMVKYFTPMTGVLLVGDKPTWYKGPHISTGDVYGRKEYSIMLKVAHGPDDNFLMTYDDVYALRPFDENLPDYFHGLCGNKRPADKIYRELYRNTPSTWMDFDGHYPMIMNGVLFRNRMKEHVKDMPIKTFYKEGFSSWPHWMPDCKLRGTPTYKQIVDFASDKPFLSTKDNIHRGGFLRFLNEQFPVPSQYE